MKIMKIQLDLEGLKIVMTIQMALVRQIRYAKFYNKKYQIINNCLQK